MQASSATASTFFAGEAALASPNTLADLVRQREELVRRQGSAAATPFTVNVTPPQTCQPMNITFRTGGGKPPFVIFVGFANWYSTTVTLPASYADSDVDTWLYQFPVPVFQPTVAGSSSTPAALVSVGDSTGHLLNTSSFQTVTQGDTSCGNVQGNLDFTFYTYPDAPVCADLGIFWQNASATRTWKDPLNAYFLPERAPPVHIPITNSSAGMINYTLAVTPGKQYVFTMTDQTGSGGVSGVNLAGGSEYVSQDCLTQPPKYDNALPVATTTLSDAKMPDFTAILSSTVTGADGSVQTSTTTQTVHRGSVESSDLSTNTVIGIAVGVAVATALLAACATWLIWRRRHGRRIQFWDLPASADSELSKSGASAPIDRRFLRDLGAQRQASSTGSMTAPMLTLSPNSDSSDGHEQRRHLQHGVRHGNATLVEASDSSAADSYSHIHDAGSDGQAPRWSSSVRTRGVGVGSLSKGSGQHGTLIPTYSDHTSPPSSYAPGTGSFALGSGSNDGSAILRRSSGSSSASNPFSAGVPSSSARSYRPLGGANDSNHAASTFNGHALRGLEGEADGAGFETVPMVETQFNGSSGTRHSNATSGLSRGGGAYQMTRDASEGSSATGTMPISSRALRQSAYARGSSGSNSLANVSASSARRSAGRDIVQHSDAGLLMDDSLEDEDALGRIELPPQYHQLPSARAREARTGSGGSAAASPMSPRSRANNVDLVDLRADGDLGQQSARTVTDEQRTRTSGDAAGEQEEEDESEFWRSPPSGL